MYLIVKKKDRRFWGARQLKWFGKKAQKPAQHTHLYHPSMACYPRFGSFSTLFQLFFSKKKCPARHSRQGIFIHFREKISGYGVTLVAVMTTSGRV